MRNRLLRYSDRRWMATPRAFVGSFISLAALMVMFAVSATADDWPMWRYDAGRSASSPANLPERLELRWQRSEGAREQAWDDPLNLDLMAYDRLFEPIVKDGRMFVGYSDRDKVAAINVDSGEEIWSFFTDAPVRMPAVAWRDRVYFTSDDGKLYCVDAQSGNLHWQFSGGLSNRKVIGNRRITSAWPSRGGPVIRDDKLYFSASIWPMMGVFIYCIDPSSGEVLWTNDSTSHDYIKQPHSAPSFAGVAPQGALVATERDLIVPGGRSVPAVFDRASGQLRYYELNAGGKGTGGSFVVATDEHFFVHTRLKGVREFNLPEGDKTAFMPNEPILSGDLVYSAETAPGGNPVVRAYDRKREVIWEVAADGRGDLIQAGDRIYAAGPQGLFAISLPQNGNVATVVWSMKSAPDIERLLAASGHLFAVTLSGRILAFGSADDPDAADGDNDAGSAIDVSLPIVALESSGKAKERAALLLDAGQTDGFAIWFGADDDDELIDAVAEASQFQQLAVVDPSSEKIDALRKRLDAAGRYGAVTAHVATPIQFDASPYMADQIFVAHPTCLELLDQPELLSRVYQSVRPYGGVMQLLVPADLRHELAKQVQSLALEQADVQVTDDGVAVRRVGALPGSADWTHQNGDIANTRKSNDARVKLPLGVLWFGGSSNMDVLPRHGHGPPQQVVDGRLFIQGINVLSARDVYTGRVLWKREFEDLGTFDVYYDSTYQDTPLDPAYNQVHIPGANARGTNYVVTPERIYLVDGAVCRVLDPATGDDLNSIELPQQDPENPQSWSYIGVYDDVLIGGLGFAKYRKRLGLSFEEEDAELRASKAGFGSKSLDRAGSMAIVGFDRFSGEVLWKVDAVHSFWNNGIVAGNDTVYCLDRNPKSVEDKLKRRGETPPNSYRILALDAHTGQTRWEVSEGIFGTWLGYSQQHDLLLQAGAAASDRLSIEVDTGMTVYRGRDGVVKWSLPNLQYSGPCILHNDLIITNSNSYRESAGAFYLDSGKPYLIDNPLTGQQQPWKLTRAYGCNTILASENLLTFRSGAAGFYDLTTHSGTGNLGGFKSGCTGNLIAANGVLNAPDYTRTCSCAYQNQTSLALIHMPEMETWTVNLLAQTSGDGRPVERIGINFGAPGHRREAGGALWVESPTMADGEQPLSIDFPESMTPFRRHSSSIADSDKPWVYASGLEGEGEIVIGTSLGDNSAQSAETLTSYRVRLYFADPGLLGDSKQRIFDVVVGNDQIVSDITIAKGIAQVHELPVVEVNGTLSLKLVAKQGKPLISGIELERLP